MTKNLESFLRELAHNPALKTRYMRDPVAVMTEKELATDHQLMILSGYSQGLQAVMSADQKVVITHINRFGSPVRGANCLVNAA